MTATYKESSVTLVKVTFGGLSSPFPQDVSIPGLKAGDVVLVVTSSTGLIISGGGNNTVEGIVSQDDYLKVKGVLDDANPYTVVLARI
jgi:hypothetical protein